MSDLAALTATLRMNTSSMKYKLNVLNGSVVLHIHCDSAALEAALTMNTFFMNNELHVLHGSCYCISTIIWQLVKLYWQRTRFMSNELHAQKWIPDLPHPSWLGSSRGSYRDNEHLSWTTNNLSILSVYPVYVSYWVARKEATWTMNISFMNYELNDQKWIPHHLYPLWFGSFWWSNWDNEHLFLELQITCP